MIKLKNLILNCFSILFLLCSTSLCPPKPRGKATRKFLPQPKPVFKTIAIKEPTTYAAPQFFTENTQIISLSPEGLTQLIIDGDNVIVVTRDQTLIFKNLFICPRTSNPFSMKDAKLVLDDCIISLMLETSNLNINPKKLKIKGNVTFIGTPETPLITPEIPKPIPGHETEQKEVVEFLFEIPKETELILNANSNLTVDGKLLITPSE